MHDLSISIVSYNTKELLRQCLNSIKENTDEVDYEIIVVDNCSNDFSADMVEIEFPDVRLIKNRNNLFFANAHTQALQIARGNYFCMLNPDMIILKDTIRTLVGKIKSDNKIGAIGCKLLSEDDKVQETLLKRSTIVNFLSMSKYLSKIFRLFITDRRYLPALYEKEGPVEVLQNSLMILRREFLIQKKLFDKNIKLYCTEDQIYEELRKENLQVYYTPDVTSIHLLGRSTKPDSNSFFIYKINRNDNYYFFKKYRGIIPAVIVYLLLSIDLLLILIIDKIKKLYK